MPSVIRALWRRFSGPLIGVPTGTASGLYVIDIDPAGILGNRGAIEPPAGVREVVLAADSDGKQPAPDASQADPESIIEAAAARHRSLGREVWIACPPTGADFNDLLPAGAGAMAA